MTRAAAATVCLASGSLLRTSTIEERGPASPMIWCAMCSSDSGWLLYILAGVHTVLHALHGGEQTHEADDPREGEVDQSAEVAGGRDCPRLPEFYRPSVFSVTTTAVPWPRRTSLRNPRPN